MLVFDRGNPNVFECTLIAIRGKITQGDVVELEGPDHFEWQHLEVLGLARRAYSRDGGSVAFTYTGEGEIRVGGALVGAGVWFDEGGRVE